MVFGEVPPFASVLNSIKRIEQLVNGQLDVGRAQ